MRAAAVAARDDPSRIDRELAAAQDFAVFEDVTAQEQAKRRIAGARTAQTGSACCRRCAANPNPVARRALRAHARLSTHTGLSAALPAARALSDFPRRAANGRTPHLAGSDVARDGARRARAERSDPSRSSPYSALFPETHHGPSSSVDGSAGLRASYGRALERTRQPAERRFLEARLARL